MVKIGEKVEDFEVDAYHKDEIRKVKLSDYEGQWRVVFFYPRDFTFVCPTELGQLAAKYEEFQKEGAEILSVSADTAFVHKAWHDESPTINQIQYPMLADPSGKVCRQFEVFVEEDGAPRRGSFLIDPDGVLKAFEVHDDTIGRSADELLRKLQAAKFVREHGGQECPANWKPGEKSVKPSLDLVGKI